MLSFQVTTTSVNGRGVLTITNAQVTDAGAYTCEAMNSNGYIFGTPDAILIVIRKFCVDILRFVDLTDRICYYLTDMLEMLLLPK